MSLKGNKQLSDKKENNVNNDTKIFEQRPPRYFCNQKIEYNAATTRERGTSTIACRENQKAYQAAGEKIAKKKEEDKKKTRLKRSDNAMCLQTQWDMEGEEMASTNKSIRIASDTSPSNIAYI